MVHCERCGQEEAVVAASAEDHIAAAHAAGHMVTCDRCDCELSP